MPPLEKTENEDTETQPSFDTDAAVAEISSDLFGQGGKEEVVEGEGTEAAEDQSQSVEGKEESSGAPADAAPPSQTEEEKAAAEAADTSKEVQEVGAPKTWTKEALAEWATISPRAQQEILKREEDFLKGITQYKADAEYGQSYKKVIEPYAPILAAENTDPVQLVQSFASNHYLLSRGTPEQKVQLAAGLLTGYKIPLADLLNYIAEADTPLEVDPNVSRLETELKDLRGKIETRDKEATDRQALVVRQEVETFASDPAHPYFDELASDIGKIFEAGLAANLQEAYDKAVFANPVTRQKEIDRLTAEKTSAAQTEEQKRKDKIARSTADSVTTIPKSRDGTVPIGSMDDTLRETMAAIENRS